MKQHCSVRRCYHVARNGNLCLRHSGALRSEPDQDDPIATRSAVGRERSEHASADLADEYVRLRSEFERRAGWGKQ